MQKERIAIIGVGCRFPGGVSSKDSLWKFLVEGRKASLKCHPIAGTWSDIMMRNRAWLANPSPCGADLLTPSIN